MDFTGKAIKSPRWEGFGRLKALPTKNKFHWYEKQFDKPLVGYTNKLIIH
ncbi:hypothetical protein SPONL_2056 [uncultured Candidatus Thioglobus sp.]|nr:hypothetical protein SPONL_2056 [uncultured Candidatus Thioglobus sp.]